MSEQSTSQKRKQENWEENDNQPQETRKENRPTQENGNNENQPQNARNNINSPQNARNNNNLTQEARNMEQPQQEDKDVNQENRDINQRNNENINQNQNQEHNRNPNGNQNQNLDRYNVDRMRRIQIGQPLKRLSNGKYFGVEKYPIEEDKHPKRIPRQLEHSGHGRWALVPRSRKFKGKWPRYSTVMRIEPYMESEESEEIKEAMANGGSA